MAQNSHVHIHHARCWIAHHRPLKSLKQSAGIAIKSVILTHTSTSAELLNRLARHLIVIKEVERRTIGPIMPRQYFLPNRLDMLVQILTHAGKEILKDIEHGQNSRPNINGARRAWHGAQLAAGASRTLENMHAIAQMRQLERGCQTGNARANNDDILGRAV